MSLMKDLLVRSSERCSLRCWNILSASVQNLVEQRTSLTDALGAEQMCNEHMCLEPTPGLEEEASVLYGFFSPYVLKKPHGM